MKTPKCSVSLVPRRPAGGVHAVVSLGDKVLNRLIFESEDLKMYSRKQIRKALLANCNAFAKSLKNLKK